MSRRPDVLIVGAGLAGCLLARLLGRSGHHVLVCEGRNDPRERNYAQGRSINLAISARGLHGLEQAGLKERTLQHAIPMPGRMIHDRSGQTTFQPYSKDPAHAINSVSRSELNLLLIDAADELENVEMRFGCKASRIDLDEGVVEFTDTGDGSVSTETADIVVGADGAGSVIRKAMEKTEDFQASQEFLDHGYKELSIPPVAEGPHAPFAMDPKALHIWPHGASMMIALPNQDGSFTCTLFWPRTGEHSFASPTTEEVVAFFEEWYPDAVPVMPELATEYRENPVSPLGTVRCAPWHQGRFVLIGDAAHAIVPFYGQGANASFEDAVALAREIEEGGRDVPAALERYYRDRVEHANAIADMALANFIEMRDHTASRGFRLRKKLERILHRVLGRRFVPLYEMVSFTLIPYADARRRARRQWRLAISGGLGLMLLIVVGAIIILT